MFITFNSWQANVNFFRQQFLLPLRSQQQTIFIVAAAALALLVAAFCSIYIITSSRFNRKPPAEDSTTDNLPNMKGKDLGTEQSDSINKHVDEQTNELIDGKEKSPPEQPLVVELDKNKPSTKERNVKNNDVKKEDADQEAATGKNRQEMTGKTAEKSNIASPTANKETKSTEASVKQTSQLSELDSDPKADAKEVGAQLDFGYIQRGNGTHFFVVLDTANCLVAKIEKLLQELEMDGMNLEVLNISKDEEYKKAFGKDKGYAILVKQHDGQDTDHSKGHHRGNTLFDTFQKAEKAAEKIFGPSFSISNGALKHLAEFEDKVTMQGAIPLDLVDASYADMNELKDYLSNPQKPLIKPFVSPSPLQPSTDKADRKLLLNQQKEEFEGRIGELNDQIVTLQLALDDQPDHEDYSKKLKETKAELVQVKHDLDTFMAIVEKE